MKILEKIPLNNLNWFKSGGPARLFCEPQNANELRSALRLANDNSYNIFILGEGANILVSDEGFDGLVIRPQILEISHTENLVRAGAGTKMDDLIKYSLDNKLLGLEEFSGIPGTVGGSIFINIHYFEFLLSKYIYSATIINKKTLKIQKVFPKWFEFGYNKSKLHENNHLLVDATFKLTPTTIMGREFARGRSFEITRQRNKRYPTSHTCGSFFRNFYESEVPIINNKKLIYVAYYLDKVGIKGNLRTGNAFVSHLHANMIINKSGKSSNAISLTRRMQELVYEHFEILPMPECRLVGFKNYPLHTLEDIQAIPKQSPSPITTTK